MNPQELKTVLDKHQKWLNRDSGGARANLFRANLSGADLSGANLFRADLSEADLSGANLSEADLSGANLFRANLFRANLSGADLTDIRNLPAFQICPTEGSFIAWKKLAYGVICKLRITKGAKRTSSIIGRKCRASYVMVLEGEGVGWRDKKTKYTPGKITRADSYNDDPRLECTNGIHFFITREEAKNF